MDDVNTYQPSLFDDWEEPEPPPSPAPTRLLPTPTVSLAAAGPVDPDRYLRRGKHAGKNPFQDLDDAIASLGEDESSTLDPSTL